MAERTTDDSDLHPEWSFQFILQSRDGASPVPESRCEELLDLAIAWAEANELAIGGGYVRYRIDEVEES